MDSSEILRRYQAIQEEQKRLEALQQELLAMAEEVEHAQETRERRAGIGSVNELVERIGLNPCGTAAG